MIAGLPEAAAPRDFGIPAVFETRLENGLRIFTVPRPGIPLIAGQVILRRGALEDAPSQAGISSLAATLLGYGSRDLKSERFSEAIEAIGAGFSASAGYESTAAGVSALSSLFGRALGLGAQALIDPACDGEDLERIRARVISDIRVGMSSSTSLARLVAGRVLFGDHPYGMPLGGTAESVEGIELGAISTMLAERTVPGGSALVLVGDLRPEEGEAFARAAFGNWNKPDSAAAPAAPVVPPAPGRTVAIDLPDSGRSAVVVGVRAPARDDPRYLAVTVLSSLLSGYSGRLNQEIRVKRGLSYGAGAGFHARRSAGSLLASTMVEHAKVGETVEVVRDVFAAVASQAPSDEELAVRKAILRGAFGRGLETTAGLAGMIGSRFIFDLPMSELDTYLARLEAVTAQEVASAARDLLTEGALHVIAVGDLVAIRTGAPQLRFEEYAASEIDLRSASLTHKDR